MEKAFAKHPMCHPHLTGREGKNSERHSSQGSKTACSVPALAPTTVWSVSYMTDVYSLNCGTTASSRPGPRQHWNLPWIEERAIGRMLQAGRSTRRHRGPLPRSLSWPNGPVKTRKQSLVPTSPPAARCCSRDHLVGSHRWHGQG